MSEPNDNWDAAPKDGSAISIEFPNGTPALARWNANASPAAKWEVRDSAGYWRGMKYWHGTSTPARWWPMIQIPREALAQWAATKPTIGALYVFGGYAVGTAHAGSDLDLAFDFVGVDEQLAELIANAERWKVELSQLTGLVVKDLYLSTESAAQKQRELVFSRFPRPAPAAPWRSWWPWRRRNVRRLRKRAVGAADTLWAHIGKLFDRFKLDECANLSTQATLEPDRFRTPAQTALLMRA